MMLNAFWYRHLSADLGMTLAIMFDVIVGNIEISTFFTFFSFFILNALYSFHRCLSLSSNWNVFFIHFYERACAFPNVYLFVCVRGYMCSCAHVSTTVCASERVCLYQRLCQQATIWEFVYDITFENLCLQTCVVANKHVFERACLQTCVYLRSCMSANVHTSANVCGCVCKRVRLRTCLWSVNSAFSFSLPAAPAAIRAWGLSRESLVIIFASPGVRHLASGSAGCPITQGSLRTSDVMNHKYLRVGIG